MKHTYITIKHYVNYFTHYLQSIGLVDDQCNVNFDGCKPYRRKRKYIVKCTRIKEEITKTSKSIESLPERFWDCIKYVATVGKIFEKRLLSEISPCNDFPLWTNELLKLLSFSVSFCFNFQEVIFVSQKIIIQSVLQL